MPPRVSASTYRLKKVFRQTFEVRVDGIGSVMLHTLLTNPEEMSQEELSRSTVTQTLGGAFITDFGSGLPTVTLSGKTGYGLRTSAEGLQMDGYQAFTELRRYFRVFTESASPSLLMYWYNWEDEEYYQIQPSSFKLQRSRSEPLLYRYDIKFTLTRRLTNSRNEVTKDYLLDNPRTRSISRDLSKSISNYSEIFTLLLGG